MAEPRKGNTEGTLRPPNVSTKQARIAAWARDNPTRVFTSLHHLLDIEWLRYAYELTRKDGAPGIDGQSAADYEKNLEDNLQSLLVRIKSGRYVAPPARRAYIPKADGSSRSLGIPTFEDKVAQRAIVMLLEPLYEQEFLPCSYGFRPGRSAREALHDLRAHIMERVGRWVLDVDLRRYFDTIDKGHLRAALDQRVRDGVVRRMIDKWLNAGVLEASAITRSDVGTPQGGVVSPLLSNVFLHYVLDTWLARYVVPRMKRQVALVRFCDDFVMVFEDFLDCVRVHEVRDVSMSLRQFSLEFRAVARRVGYRTCNYVVTCVPTASTFGTASWRRTTQAKAPSGILPRGLPSGRTRCSVT